MVNARVVTLRAVLEMLFMYCLDELIKSRSFHLNPNREYGPVSVNIKPKYYCHISEGGGGAFHKATVRINTKKLYAFK